VDVRTWLRRNGHAEVASQIDGLVASWARAGKRTRRNWWDILAGGNRGRPRRVGGVTFPVLPEATARQAKAKAMAMAMAKRRELPPAGARGRGSEGSGGRPAARAKVPPAAPPTRARTRLSRRSSAANHPTPPDAEADGRRARPFLKWAGGKRQLLPEIRRRLPATFATLHEPFVGGGALFFALAPRAAVLSDSNERLIRAYKGVRDSVEEVITLLETYPKSKPFFLDMRRRDIDVASDAEVAAWMIYLNKTGFNGLYRVNSRNLFNVPYGATAGWRILDAPNLRACAAALATADLRCEDFSKVASRALPGDIVYFDPPYVPVSVTSDFTSYTKGGFDRKDQERLRDTALALRDRGVFVLLSNSSAPEVTELYGAHFDCIPILASRRVNADPKGRGRVGELLIMSPPGATKGRRRTG
jgi:DNA adenine methylase